MEKEGIITLLNRNAASGINIKNEKRYRKALASRELETRLNGLQSTLPEKLPYYLKFLFYRQRKSKWIISLGDTTARWHA